VDARQASEFVVRKVKSMFRKKAQPKEWGDVGPQLPIEEVSPDEWEVRHLTRQKMVGWILPYSIFPTLNPLTTNGKIGIVEMVALETGKCLLSGGVLCSECFTKEQRQQFVREELLNMYRDIDGKLVMLK